MEGFKSNQTGGSASSPYVQQFLSPRDQGDQGDSEKVRVRVQPVAPSSPLHRPRGRPPGSKNKPKAPVVVTRDTPNTLRCHVLEVAAGTDIVECLNEYARRGEKGVFVMSGRGTVSNVNIRQVPSGIVALQGGFEILGLSGAVLPAPVPTGAGGLSIILAGGQGQMLGGIVVGPLIATEKVVLIAAVFPNVVFERLPVEDQEADGNAGGQSAGSQSSGVSGGVGLPLFHVEGNVATPPGPAHSTFAFSADLSGWGGSNVAIKPPF
ncbi:hypothetical protein DCAR_0417027 [Daucus carota subsp. sativus]|uniref:PPC domain-containing protein n=1 Tax=Daucus carota subsp. sativus TaxID=79200 RepID=A0A162AB71_DAUCS|nr:PREDICTED: AT-hook motif nuclear-localized protein 27 [Daucus carota subsp. sativus]WOG97686.1 hypothetical protein DCAR_0417027 [Daucus carota subsp. sativus]